MKNLRSIFRTAIAATLAVAAASASATEASAPLVVAAADCYGIGQQVAAENGGTLAKATPAKRGGQDVCVIVVLVPAKDGQRPRRVEFVVPAG